MTREEYEERKRNIAEELETAFENLSTSACVSVNEDNNIEDIISKADSDLHLCMEYIELVRDVMCNLEELLRETVEEEEVDK